MLIQCCVCLKVRQGKKWVTVAKPYQAMRNASHTYCPECLKVSFKSLKKVRV